MTIGERRDRDGNLFAARDRRRAFFSTLPVLATVGLVDTLASGPGPRSAWWAAWCFSFALLAGLTGRFGARADAVLGACSGVFSVAMVLRLAALSGGSQSVFFVGLAMVPLMSGLVAPGDLVGQGLQGLVAVLGGVGLLVSEGAPASRIVSWAALIGVSVAYALFSSEALRRRQLAYVALEKERADALERLSEAESRNAQAQRWAAAALLADEVAHDVNSPLAALRSTLRFAQEEILAGRAQAAREAIDDGRACAERIHGIVSGLSQRIGRTRKDRASG